MSKEIIQRRNATTPAILILLGLVIICALTVVAQSGRRGRGSSSTPPATPEPSPTPAASKSPEKPGVTVILGIDTHDVFTNIPLYFNDTVLQSCAERLDSKLAVKVVTSRNMSRNDAIKRAKSEKEAYVALLLLRVDSVGLRDSNADLSQAFIEFFVFAPTSAKQVGSGNVYQRSAGYKDVILGRPSSGSAAYVEYRLKEAAREAADRILAAL